MPRDIEDGAELTFHFENRHPVDVTDLGSSLQALGTQYEEYVAASGHDLPAVNARLYIKSASAGSIIVKLHTLLDQASFLVKNIEILAGFVTNIYEIIEYLLNDQKAPKPAAITPSAVERISSVMEPVAKDGGSKLTININVVGNTAPVTVAPVVISSIEANAVQNAAKRYLGAKPSTAGPFKKELLQLYQMKGDANAKTGDRGIIEKFSQKPVKLHFMTPDVKANILDQQDNPFKMAYVVDGEVSTVGGQPGLYKIQEVHEAIEKP
jgi:hypothetical protein